MPLPPSPLSGRDIKKRTCFCGLPYQPQCLALINVFKNFGPAIGRFCIFEDLRHPPLQDFVYKK